MTADDERWLRDRLTAVVDAEPPPADLATRAERTAGRIRRRRYGAAAAVVAVAVAVPLVLAGTRTTDRSLPPARPTDPACMASDQVLPDQPEAVTPADAAWPYRGDPTLRPELERVMAASVSPPARPLYAQRLADPAGSAVFVFASEFATGAQWLVVAAVRPADPPDRAAVTPDGFAASARLPQLSADAQVSLLVPIQFQRGGPLPASGWDRWSNLLVALAPPGADGIAYHACYRGRAFTVDGPGDVLVREVGPVDAPGRVTVRDGGMVVAAGEVGDPLFGEPAAVRPAVEAVRAPDGMREVQRLSWHGGPQVAQTVSVSVPAARLLARCRGPAPLEVAVDDQVLGRVPCDEQVHVLADGVTLDQGRPLTVRGAPELRGQEGLPVPYEVVVVTAG